MSKKGMFARKGDKPDPNMQLSLHVEGAVSQAEQEPTLKNRSSFGPNSTRPAQIWPYACVPDPNCSEPSREGRALVCNRAVERRTHFHFHSLRTFA